MANEVITEVTTKDDFRASLRRALTQEILNRVPGVFDRLKKEVGDAIDDLFSMEIVLKDVKSGELKGRFKTYLGGDSEIEVPFEGDVVNQPAYDFFMDIVQSQLNKRNQDFQALLDVLGIGIKLIF